MSKNQRVVAIIAAILIIVLIIIAMIPIIHSNYDLSFLTIHEIEMDTIAWDKKYTTDLQLKLSGREIVTLEEVYDFDWDKAYVIGISYDDIVALRHQYGFFKYDGSDFGSGRIRRVVIFIKNDQYLCSHQRTTDDFIITNEEVIITKQTKLKSLGNNEYEFIEGFEYYELAYDNQGKGIIKVKDDVE